MNTNHTVLTKERVETIELSEIRYMMDRMAAIESREGNPEGIEIGRFGNSVCLYSKTMPWPSFNAVKGLRDDDVDHLDAIVAFYAERDRKAKFEIVPGLSGPALLEALAKRGFYQSGFHTSMYVDLMEFDVRGEENEDRVVIKEIAEDGFEAYAAIHCRGTGLSDDGIPHVARNNKVLYGRLGWKFYLAFVDETPAAASVMHMADDVASLTFAATLPQFRSMGLQQKLLLRRLAEAAQNGCRLAVSQCAFLSQSQRNMERVGMRTGYVRTTWSAL